MIVVRKLFNEQDPNEAGKKLRTAGKVGMAAGVASAVGGSMYAGHHLANTVGKGVQPSIGKLTASGTAMGLGKAAAVTGLAAYGIGKFKQYRANKRAQNQQQ